MSGDGGVVRQAAQLIALVKALSQAGVGAVPEGPRPVHWPKLTPEETKEEWNGLRGWVESLRVRYPNAIRLPECWWRHNDLVEVLAALRDFERACFADAAPGTAAVEWQRALRDMEIRMEIWIKRFTCAVPGRRHDVPEPVDAVPAGWEEFIADDEQRRRRDAPHTRPEDTSSDN